MSAIHRRPRVAIVVAGAGAGGAVARVALAHAAGLSGRFAITLLSNSLPVNCAGCRVEKIPAAGAARLGRFGHVVRAIGFARACAKRLAGLPDRPDFVWCHGHGEAWAAARAGFAGRVGMTVHGDIFSRPPGTYDPLLTMWYRWVSPRAYRTSRIVHLLSEAGRAAAIRSGAEAERCMVLPNGISEAEFGRVPPRCDPPGKRILFVGRISAEKGLDDLLRAMESPTLADATLEVIGDGPLAAQSRRQAEKLGDRVRFVGWVARGKIGAHFRKANVLCCPSLDEPFATVLLEAMIFGLPVVATAVGGSPSIVVDGVTGLLCPPSDPQALAGALTGILADPVRAREMGGCGRQRVLKEFSWEKICARLGDHILAAIA